MSHNNFRFPHPFAAVIARLPAKPPSFVFAQLLNLVLRQPAQLHNLRLLYGKRIAIHVIDLGLQLNFTVSNSGFLAISRPAQSDLLIAATAYDFYLLAARKEDPDSLFFNQRLLVEGDTELGLIAKNTLDSLDLIQVIWPRHLSAWLKTNYLYIRRFTKET